MTRGPGLSALLVNYNSGAFAVRCAESLRKDWLRGGRDPARLEIVVVDNASPEDQSEHLTRLEELGCKVVRNDSNPGYSGGINLAWRHSTGEPGDAVAILNSDLHFLPGSVGTLVDHVTGNPDVGIVDPRACMDQLGVLNLPRNLLPTPFDLLGMTLAHLSPFWCRVYSRRRVRLNMQWFTAERPIETDMISGACMFLRRETIQRLGQPMDERFPLYYEDTDLCRRVARLGLKIVHHGGARILHHWSRSVGLGPSYFGEPRRRHDVSQVRYYEKYYGRLGLWWVEVMQWLQRRWPPEKLNRPMYPLGDLGTWRTPIEVPLPRDTDYMIEVALDPTFIVAVGIFGSGSRWVCPDETWEWFFPIPYFVRAVDQRTGEHMGAWRASKEGLGREAPLETDGHSGHDERVLEGRSS